MFDFLYMIFSLLSAFIFAVYWYQDNFLYFANSPDTARYVVPTPESVGLPYEEIFLISKSGLRLHGYFIRQKSPEAAKDAPTILFFHGNAGNIGHRVQNASLLYSGGYNVLLMEYRGYGKSDGAPSEEGFKADGELALEFLLGRGDINPRKIVLFGRSLGGAVAAHVASVRSSELMGVVLENTFLSIPKMVDIVMPIMKRFKFLCRNVWATDEIIHKITTPILFISGSADEVVPARMMHELHGLATAKRKFLSVFANGRHNETWTEPGYADALNQFMRSLLPVGAR